MTANREPVSGLRTKALVVGLGAVVVLSAGLGYAFWANARLTDDLAERQARALATIEEFQTSTTTGTPAPDSTSEGRPEAETETRPESDDALPAGPLPQPGEVIVVHRVPGEDYGRLAIRHEDGGRTLLARRCVRVHLAAGNGACLAQDDGFVTSYATTLFRVDDPTLAPIRTYPIPLPSRVRVSPDGSRMTSTSFLSGSSYADIGATSSTLVLFDDFADPLSLRLDDFYLDRSGRDDVNEQLMFWGVSFVDADRFYVTGAAGGEPEILVGSYRDRTIRPTGLRGSCPSVSPDGRTLVYKQLRDDGGFDLVAVDLETDSSQVLNEKRSVDDQVEWLDNDTILYAVHPDTDVVASHQPDFDIWSLDIRPGAEPELFLPSADSPAVVR